MYARLFDVLHDAANQHHFAVADSIHVHFNRIIKETVQQHRCIVRHADRSLEVATQVGFVIDDFHRATTENVGWAHHQRVTNFFRLLNSLFNGRHGGVRRLFQLQTVNRVLEALTVFRTVNGIRAGTDYRHACCFQRARQLQRSLATVLHNNAFRLLDAHDFQYVFQRYRLEVQTVGGVVVGRNGFRVTVDHDGLKTIFAQCQRGVYAAVVKLDALTDTVWTAAQHHDFIAVDGRICFTLIFISGVHVGGVGGKFCCAGIHALVDRMQIVLVTQFANFRFANAGQFRQTRIGETFTFQHAQEVSVEAVDAKVGYFFFQAYQFFNLHQEPAVDVGQVEHAVDGQARAEGIGDIPDTLCARVFQLAANFGQRFRIVQAYFRVEAGRAHFQTTQRFLQRFLLGTANRHHFTDRFHLRGQTVVSANEFLEVETGNFRHNVVDGRLKRSRSAAASDVVHQLVECVTYRQLGSDFSNREAGCFGRQR